jgi:hypothetical protein
MPKYRSWLSWPFAQLKRQRHWIKLGINWREAEKTVDVENKKNTLSCKDTCSWQRNEEEQLNKTNECKIQVSIS